MVGNIYIFVSIKLLVWESFKRKKLINRVWTHSVWDALLVDIGTVACYSSICKVDLHVMADCLKTFIENLEQKVSGKNWVEGKAITTYVPTGLLRSSMGLNSNFAPPCRSESLFVCSCSGQTQQPGKEGPVPYIVTPLKALLGILVGPNVELCGRIMWCRIMWFSSSHAWGLQLRLTCSRCIDSRK